MKHGTVNVPSLLLAAARDREAYFEAHRVYCERYCATDTEAFRLLEKDLDEYGLPGRYSSENSFWVNRRSHVVRLMGPDDEKK